MALALVLVAPGLASALDLELEAAFDPEMGELPESIAIDRHGNTYLSMANTLRVIDRDGGIEIFGTLPINAFALGIEIGPDGCVYAASTSLDPEIVGAFVWRICEQGEVEEFATLDPSGGPNDLAFDRAGNAYVTDTFLGRIYRIDAAGQVSTWLSHPALLGNPDAPALGFRAFGVNGIAFRRRERALYVSNLDAGQILRIPIGRDGMAEALEVFASDELLVGADGLAFDRRGNLVVAINASDSVASVDRDGIVTVLAEGGFLDSPSAIAFGAVGRDRRTLYVTSSAVLRAFGVKPGTPMPALVRGRHRADRRSCRPQPP